MNFVRADRNLVTGDAERPFGFETALSCSGISQTPVTVRTL